MSSLFFFYVQLDAQIVQVKIWTSKEHQYQGYCLKTATCQFPGTKNTWKSWKNYFPMIWMPKGSNKTQWLDQMSIYSLIDPPQFPCLLLCYLYSSPQRALSGLLHVCLLDKPVIILLTTFLYLPSSVFTCVSGRYSGNSTNHGYLADRGEARCCSINTFVII